MTTQPPVPAPDDDDSEQDPPGAEIGISEEGSTFEPEEDLEGQS